MRGATALPFFVLAGRFNGSGLSALGNGRLPPAVGKQKAAPT